MGCSQFNFQESNCTQVDIGFDYFRTLTVTDDGGAVDLTDSIFIMVIKDALGGNVILTLNIVGDADTTGFYIADPETGLIDMQILEAENTPIPPGWYVYEMTVEDPFGHTGIFMQGSIQFSSRGF